MPIPESFRPLIDVLDDGTTRGAISWRETAGFGEFFVAIPSYSVKIYRGEKRASTPPLIGTPPLNVVPPEFVGAVTVAVLDGQGNEVDSFTIRTGDSDYWKIDQLYEAAKRQARKLDATLKDVAERLRAQMLAR